MLLIVKTFFHNIKIEQIIQFLRVVILTNKLEVILRSDNSRCVLLKSLTIHLCAACSFSVMLIQLRFS